MTEQERIRIDKWLWAVRIFKTRSLSNHACNSGKVKIKGKSVKPAKLIAVGDVVSVQKQFVRYEYLVKGLITKRVSAKIAAENVEDLTPDDELLKLKVVKNLPVANRDKGAGRPTKKERRILDEFQNSIFHIQSDE